MQKFFKSGAAFMVVALICLAAGLKPGNGAAFIGLGAFWLIMAIVVRSKNAKKPPPGDD
jgi:succinate-acetate transporter protein